VYVVGGGSRRKRRVRSCVVRGGSGRVGAGVRSSDPRAGAYQILVQHAFDLSLFQLSSQEQDWVESYRSGGKSKCWSGARP
jgi:hypothetical protein